MLPPEYDQILFHQLPDVVEPQDTVFDSAIYWLKSTAIHNVATDSILQPISTHPQSRGLIEAYLYSAWNDTTLRLGYLPSTPRYVAGITRVVSYWLDQPNLVLYAFGNPLLGEWNGFMTFSFLEEVEGIYAELTYGIFDSLKQSRSLTTQALSLARAAIDYAFYAYGVPFVGYRTQVSDRNLGSRRVLEKNDFSYVPADNPPPSPIVMGGYSLSVQRLPALSWHLEDFSDS